MSAVELMAYGAQAASDSSTPVDVSAHAVLRLDVVTAADVATRPALDLRIETSSSTDGPWIELERIRQHGGHTEASASETAWKAKRRLVISGFDSFVRVSWDCETHGSLNPALKLGVSGDGTPDA